jgi:hypothetical protein
MRWLVSAWCISLAPRRLLTEQPGLRGLDCSGFSARGRIGLIITIVDDDESFRRTISDLICSLGL